VRAQGRIVTWRGKAGIEGLAGEDSHADFRQESKDCMTKIDVKLLEQIACPACEERPSLAETQEGLYCAQCERTYPVVDGIPVLLIEEAVMPSVADKPAAD